MAVVSPVRHNFVAGDIVVSIVDCKKLVQWYVQEVVSQNKIRVVLFNDDGTLSETGTILQGLPLSRVVKDHIATKFYHQICTLNKKNEPK